MTHSRHPNKPPSDPTEPTPYPNVSAVIGELTVGIRSALSENLCGIYLFGSLVTGDFDPRRSDVALLVVTDADVSAEQFAALDALFRGLARSESPWADEVEAYILTRAALRRED